MKNGGFRAQNSRKTSKMTGNPENLQKRQENQGQTQGLRAQENRENISKIVLKSRKSTRKQ